MLFCTLMRGVGERHVDDGEFRSSSPGQGSGKQDGHDDGGSGCAQ